MDDAMNEFARLFQPLLDAQMITMEDIEKAIERRKRQKWHKLRTWGGMPQFVHVPRKSLSIKFDTEEEKRQFLKSIGYPRLDAKTINWSKYQREGKEHRKVRLLFDCEGENRCRYPIYVVSKGRHEYMLTSQMLTHIVGERHYVVVEESEADLYEKAVKKYGLLADVLVLPAEYQEEYDTLDDESGPVGPGAARNFCLDHSARMGFQAHWVLDDNISSISRLHCGRIISLIRGNPMAILENWSDRQPNVAVASILGEQFASTDKEGTPPLVEASRAYSFMLIKNNMVPRWRGRYNEDSIFSVDILLRGWQCVSVRQFCCGKLHTQRMPGGNTDIFYGGVSRKGYHLRGTDKKTALLYKVYPEFFDIDIRFGRVHHVWRRGNIPRPACLHSIDLPPSEYGFFLRAPRDGERWEFGRRLDKIWGG